LGIYDTSSIPNIPSRLILPKAIYFYFSFISARLVSIYMDELYILNIAEVKMKTKVSGVTIATVLLFAVSAVAQTDQGNCTPRIAWNSICSKRAKGDAIATYVLEGTTFSSQDKVNVPGTMVNNGALMFNPDTFDQTVPEGYHNGSGTVTGDPNLVSGNIKDGATIFGVTGTSIQSSGTATPDQVLTGQTFSNASGSATGTMPTQTLSDQSTTIPEGYYIATDLVSVDPDLIAGNICNGTTIFGITGTLTPSIIKKIFLTSAGWGGDLGGLAGADSKCQTLANTAGLPGTFKAWLSDAGQSPSTRFAKGCFSYQLVDGTIIANDWTDLTDGTLQGQINKDELGNLITGQTVWSNTLASGAGNHFYNYSAMDSCTNWTFSCGAGAHLANLGLADQTDGSWTEWQADSCCATRKLYCFEQ
jgi:hypothetical protein